MLRSLHEMDGYDLHAVDGEIGRLDDFLFDDDEWIVRYLVARTGGLLSRKRLLLSPSAVQRADWAGSTIHLDLTRRQIEESPDLDSDRPVSRRQQERLNRHFGWPNYWAGSPMAIGAAYGIPPVQPRPDEVARRTEEETEEPGDPHLRSVDEVVGYTIQGSDDSIGHVEDMIVEDDVWVIRYLVIDTSNWWFGRKVLVSPAWAERVDWSTRTLHLALPRATIQASPEWDPAAPVNRELETRMYDYYGRPVYWAERGRRADPPGREARP